MSFELILFYLFAAVLSVAALGRYVWLRYQPLPELPSLPALTASPVASSAEPAPTASGTISPAVGTLKPVAAPTEVRHVTIEAAGFSSDVRTMEIADSGVINPPDFFHVWWIRDRGVAPSRDATDTAYLACHTNQAKDVSVVPCNDLQPERVPLGATVAVTTDVETLRYRVTSAHTILRTDFAHAPEVWDVNPGRLVWVNCYLADGRRSEYNAVIIAELER